MDRHQLEDLEVWRKARELAVSVYREVIPGAA